MKLTNLLLALTFIATAIAAKQVDAEAFQFSAAQLSLQPGQSTTLTLENGTAPFHFRLDPPAPYGGQIIDQGNGTALYIAPSQAPDPQRPDNQGRLSSSVTIDVTDAAGHEFASGLELLAR